jgi:ribA/ribD-fused uncharacterized protein
VVYPTAEHRYQAAKSEAAGDIERLNQVIITRSPLDAKRVAGQIPDTLEWRHRRDAVLTKIIDQKFDQNVGLRDLLLNTGNKRLNEATANNYFGIGASLHSRAVRDMSYKGQNKLGQVLMAKRDQLRRDRE